MRRLVVALLPFVLGCRPTPSELTKWAAAPGGPEKLAHVVRDASAPAALRGHALTSLAEVSSNGRNVGVDLALDALDDAPGRAEVVAAIAPDLAHRIEAPHTKDLVYGILAHGHADGAAKAELRGALLAWTKTVIDGRLTGDQRFATRAAFVLLGADAARPLVALIAKGEQGAFAASIVAEVGDEATKRDASEALAAAGRSIDAPAWREKWRGPVLDSNAKAKIDAKPEQVEGQLDAIRERALEGVVEGARLLGGASAVAWLVDAVCSSSRSAEVRELAVAAAKAHVAEIDARSRDELRAALTSEPEPIVGLGPVPPIAEPAQLLAAIPEERARLAELLDDKRWFVRRDAGAALIETSRSPEDLDDTLAKLHAAPTEWEIDGYASAVPRVDGGLARMRAHVEDRSLPGKLVALKTLYATDGALVAKSEHDPTRLPVSWPCHGTTATTVGEVVQRCWRQPAQLGAQPPR